MFNLSKEHEERARRLHKESIVVDTMAGVGAASSPQYTPPMLKRLEELAKEGAPIEVIRDQIGLILASETVSQVTKAAAEPNPTDWAFRVYMERANPVELFMAQPESGFDDQTPAVSVSYDSGSFDKHRGNVIEEQVLSGLFFIDVLAVGTAHSEETGGHVTGDELAVRNAERTARLCRNILMSALNIKLQLPQIVWDRWIDDIIAFRPENNDASFQIAARRIQMRVDFSEYSPQHEGQPLEFVSVDVQRALDGKLVVEADFDYTP